MPNPGETVDHINRIRSDNRSQQKMNSGKHRQLKGREIYQYDLDGNLIKK